MCEFSETRGQKAQNFCMDRTCEYDRPNPKTTNDNCPLCEEKPLTTVNYETNDGCGLPSCNVGGIAPCGSITCTVKDDKSPDCTDDICPYRPVKTYQECIREDGRTCNIGDSPTCLQEDDGRTKDYLSKFKYKDFSKFTFDKKKYLPGSYLPGDGADFMYGYTLKPTPQERGVPPCGYPSCPMDVLDFHLNELTKPLPPLPTLPKDFCGGTTCPYKPTPVCPYRIQPVSQNNNFRTENQKQESCGGPDCPLGAKKETCGAPDCPYRSKKPCGAPDCKYADQGDIYVDSKSKRTKKRKAEGDYDSTTSCDSDICPFANIKESKESSRLSCDNPECPFAPKNDPCDDKNCPYAKEFVICQDCGGIVKEDTETIQQDTVVNNTEPVNAIQTTFEVIDKTTKPSVIPTTDKVIPVDEKKKTPDSPTSVEEKQKKKIQETLYQYPGVQIGHKYCMQKGRNIPSNMGWLWNISPISGDPQLWRGYKPGAIPKKVYKMIRAHRRELGIFDPSELPHKKKSKTSQKTQSDKYKKNCIEVRKEKGNFYVTVNPVKDPKTLEDFESPYMDCTPMQFKIIKPDKKIKPKLDENCLCDAEEESICTSSDESELDFSFSPPAAIPNYRPRKKKIVNTIETQYDTKDCGADPKEKNPGAKKGKKGDKKGKKKK